MLADHNGPIGLRNGVVRLLGVLVMLLMRGMQLMPEMLVMLQG